MLATFFFTRIFIWFIIYLQSCHVEGNSCHTSCIGPLVVWWAECGKPLISTWGAQIHLACPSWICHWFFYSFCSWCFGSFPSTCSTLFGNFAMLLYQFCYNSCRHFEPSDFFLVVWGLYLLYLYFSLFFLCKKQTNSFLLMNIFVPSSLDHQLSLSLDKERSWRVIE